MRTTLGTFPILLILLFTGCKKDNSQPDVRKFKAKVQCGDCTWYLQNGNKPLVTNQVRGQYDKEVEFEIKKGDTILFLGYNYSLTVNMDGYLYNNNQLLKHGITHCGGNPTFFIRHIVE